MLPAELYREHFKNILKTQQQISLFPKVAPAYANTCSNSRISEQRLGHHTEDITFNYAQKKLDSCYKELDEKNFTVTRKQPHKTELNKPPAP